MIAKTVVTTAALLGLASSASVPSANGFPSPNAKQQAAIAQKALGKLPGGELPKEIGNNSAVAFGLIAFNELFETAYFDSLVKNITDKVDGYDSREAQKALPILKTVLAQEQQHAIGALGILNASDRFVPEPCEYQFPVANFTSAIALAETFTAVVLGALQGASAIFAGDDEAPFVQLISSVIGQEGEQNGYYRYITRRVPSESPFLTFVPAPFAFSALQAFVVPDSCPFNLSEIPLPIFPPIATNGGPVALIEPRDQTLNLTADLSDSKDAEQYVGGNGDGLYFTITTGQQLPVSLPLDNVTWDGSVISFEVDFPYKENVAAGFSHGALTTSDNITSANDVPDSALAGPAVIQVDNSY